MLVDLIQFIYLGINVHLYICRYRWPTLFHNFLAVSLFTCFLFFDPWSSLKFFYLCIIHAYFPLCVPFFSDNTVSICSDSVICLPSGCVHWPSCFLPVLFVVTGLIIETLLILFLLVILQRIAKYEDSMQLIVGVCFQM